MEFSLSSFELSDIYFQVSDYFNEIRISRPWYLKYQLDHYYDDKKTFLKKVSLKTHCVIFISDSKNEQLYFEATTFFNVQINSKKIGNSDTYKLVNEHFRLINESINKKPLRNSVGIKKSEINIPPSQDWYQMATKLVDMMNDRIKA